MTKPQTGHRKKDRDIDKDTVVAYHDFIQGRIHGELNGIAIGPGRYLCRLAIGLFMFGLACCIVGILIISLRHRHVYLWDWNHQFVGPFFIILFLLCCGLAVFFITLAKKRTNYYRGDLAFRPIGDYGVAVVHKSKLTYDDQKKSELKSGTTPHNVRHPGRPDPNDHSYRGDYSKGRGYDNRGYRGENGGPDRRDGRDRRDEKDRHDDRDRRDERRIREDRGHRGPDDRRRDDRRPPGDRDRQRPPDDRDRRRPPDDRDRRRPPDDRDRRRPPDDRDRQRTPEDDKRREERRRQYEADKRRRYEEDRRRAELRKQAEAESTREAGGEERGVDVGGGPRTVQVTTTVTVQRPIQATDESEL